MAAAERGVLVYVFPELVRTTSRDAAWGLYPTHAPIVRGVGSVLRTLSGPSADDDYLEEPVLPFMPAYAASTDVRAVAVANWLATLALGAALGPLQLALRGGGRHLGALGAINVAYGAILLNGAAWVVLPLLRRIALLASNTGVRRRNARRRRLAAAVGGAFASEEVARQLRAAEALRVRGRKEVLRAGESATYTTAKSLLEQAATHVDPVAERWERELNERADGR